MGLPVRTLSIQYRPPERLLGDERHRVASSRIWWLEDKGQGFGLTIITCKDEGIDKYEEGREDYNASHR
jgi:hypothetical protein